MVLPLMKKAERKPVLALGGKKIETAGKEVYEEQGFDESQTAHVVLRGAF